MNYEKWILDAANGIHEELYRSNIIHARLDLKASAKVLHEHYQKHIAQQHQEKLLQDASAILTSLASLSAHGRSSGIRLMPGYYWLATGTSVSQNDCDETGQFINPKLAGSGHKVQPGENIQRAFGEALRALSAWGDSLSHEWGGSDKLVISAPMRRNLDGSVPGYRWITWEEIDNGYRFQPGDLNSKGTPWPSKFEGSEARILLDSLRRSYDVQSYGFQVQTKIPALNPKSPKMLKSSSLKAPQNPLQKTNKRENKKKPVLREKKHDRAISKAVETMLARSKA